MTPKSHNPDTNRINTNTGVSQEKGHFAMNKTSIRNINPDTLWDAKIYAAQTRQTMGEVVTEALDKLINEDYECDTEENQAPLPK
jgi:hypothetical protein